VLLVTIIGMNNNAFAQ